MRLPLAHCQHRQNNSTQKPNRKQHSKPLHQPQLQIRKKLPHLRYGSCHPIGCRTSGVTALTRNFFDALINSSWNTPTNATSSTLRLPMNLSLHQPSASHDYVNRHRSSDTESHNNASLAVAANANTLHEMRFYTIACALRAPALRLLPTTTTRTNSRMTSRARTVTSTFRLVHLSPTESLRTGEFSGPFSCDSPFVQYF